MGHPRIQARDGDRSRKTISLDGKGHLVPSARSRKEDEFLDGCVRTRRKFEHAFGYYIARIQIAAAAGPLAGVLAL